MGNLREKVEARRTAERLSFRQLCAATGVAFSTLARVQAGKGNYNRESERKLRIWLGEDVSEMISAERIRQAEEIGRIMARSCAAEIQRMVSAMLDTHNTPGGPA